MHSYPRQHSLAKMCESYPYSQRLFVSSLVSGAGATLEQRKSPLFLSEPLFHIEAKPLFLRPKTEVDSSSCSSCDTVSAHWTHTSKIINVSCPVHYSPIVAPDRFFTLWCDSSCQIFHRAWFQRGILVFVFYALLPSYSYDNTMLIKAAGVAIYLRKCRFLFSVPAYQPVNLHVPSPVTQTKKRQHSSTPLVIGTTYL